MQRECKRVLIAIQARSNSTRFYKKIFEQIGKKRVLDHVIDQANSAAKHLNKYSKQVALDCRVAVLHPSDDKELVSAFKYSDCMFIGGPEHDVLARYLEAQAMTDADYVVRLTSDCPLVLDFMISKHITTAANNEHDYVSNIEESCRSVADGFDCEVLSRRAMEWLTDNATDPSDREHVTTAIRRVRPKELNQAFIMSKLDSSQLKMSVDTKEDLEVIRKYYHMRESKMAEAVRIFGQQNIYEL